jgi:hypothetical protein
MGTGERPILRREYRVSTARHAPSSAPLQDAPYISLPVQNGDNLKR